MRIGSDGLAAGKMAKTTFGIIVEGSFGNLVLHRSRFLACLVFMMTKMRARLRNFILTIRCHGSPGELKWQ